jgi:L-ribulose-5-phosphate 3-epimerase
MRNVIPMEIGLVFWAEQESAAQMRQMDEFGLRTGQLGVPPGLDCELALPGWAAALATEQLSITSAVCAYAGEDYADMETVHKTVGFTSPEWRGERIARTKEVSDFARSLGITALSCHIGFIPEDPSQRLFTELRDLTAELCDYCGANGQSFVLETGQESARALLGFIAAVDRGNLKVNFDPANMILYGSGDPLHALEMLAAHVISIHCKDGLSPEVKGQLGEEVRLGDGEVDFPGFLRTLQKIGYQGALTIEREEPDAARRKADILTAIERLKQWKSDLGIA